MDLKKMIAATLCAMTLPAMAFGHGHLWYDRNAHVPQFGKLVIFPIVDLNGTYYYNNDDVESEPYKLNHYLNTRFIRKLDIKNTIALGDMINENRKVRTKDELEYPKLLESFSTEQERAAAVDSITGAPGYFIPRVRDVRTEPHMSPATTVRVQMQSYTTETGGPKGNRTYNKRTWTVNHTIPAKQLCLYHMDVEHALYNRKGEKILTYENNEHSYKYSSNKYVYDMFKSLTDEFKDDYKDIRKEYMDDKKNPRANGHVKIGFKEVQVPSNIKDDECIRKSVDFTMRNYALKHTKADIIYDNNSQKAPRYYIQGTIYRYSLDREWIPPCVTTYDAIKSSRESKWRDAKGNTHTMKTTTYETEIVDHFGYWRYTATVSANFSLIDALTGKILVSHNATETDDKCADAFRHFMKSFYSKVKDHFGDSE